MRRKRLMKEDFLREMKETSEGKEGDFLQIV